MASLRCHGDSDYNKTHTHKKFSCLYNTVVVIFFPYLYSLSGISYDPVRWYTQQSRGLHTFRIQTVYYNLDPTI